ncbi:hypothetical protein D3228_06175 [Leucobacter luti]|nr:hypothetical protein [Leucobacter luti]
MPTEGDAVKLESVSSAEFIDALTELGRELYEEARLSPRQEIGRSISFSTDEDADTALKASISIAIEFYVDDSGEAEECVVAFTVPPDEDFGVEQALDVMAALVPIDVAVNDISFANSIGTRNLNHAKNEIAFSWAKFS